MKKYFPNGCYNKYFNLIGYPSWLTNLVQLSVLAPVLQLAGFFLHPLWIKSESSVNILSQDEEVTIEDKIDILVLKEQLWVLVIESKRAELSIKLGLAQILAYMLATPHKQCFGLITNGGSFVFFKLVMNPTPQYSMSRVFYLVNPGNDLYSVLGILKKFVNFLSRVGSLFCPPLSNTIESKAMP